MERKKILIADDESRMRKLLKDFLRIINVFQHFYPMIFRKGSTMASRSSICGPCSITCYPFALTMELVLTVPFGKHMCLQIRYLLTRLWR